MRRHVVILLVEANDFLMAAYVAQHSLCQGVNLAGGSWLHMEEIRRGGSRDFINEVLAVQHF